VKIRVQDENCFAIEKHYNLHIVVTNTVFTYVKFKILVSMYIYITSLFTIYVQQNSINPAFMG